MSVAIICVGNASGCSNGQMISASNAPPLTRKARSDHLLFAFILLSDSIKEFSNITLPRSIRTYAYLDTTPDVLIRLTVKHSLSCKKKIQTR